MIAQKYIFGRKYGSALLTNLVAYYTLNSNSNDSSGNSHNGTDTAVSYSNAGIVGNSATFNGTSSFISVPQSTDFDFSNLSNDLPFTISFWSYASSNSGNQWVISKRGGLATIDQWQVIKLGGVLQFYLLKQPAFIGKSITTAPTLNVWEHYCFTYDGSSSISGIKTYKNGAITTSTNLSSGTYTKMPISSIPMVIGRAGWTSTGFFNGRLDEIAIWKNRELNSTEVAELYNSGLGKTYPF